MRVAALVISLCLLNLYYIEVSAQNKRIDRAYESYDAGEYYAAIDLFKDAYQKTTDKKEKVRITFHIAECYRKTNNPKQASMWYSKVISKDYEDPIALLYYADMLKMIENYDEAKVQYEAYKLLVPGDARAKDGSLSCDLANEWKKYPNGYVVNEMSFFNSRSDDFSPAYAREDYRLVYFTSMRDETSGKQEHGASGQGFADIFESTMDRKGKWSTPIPLSEEINTEVDEGTPRLSADYKTLYFTRCYFDKKKTTGCEIYVSHSKGEEWGKPEALEILSDSLVVAHPAPTPDETTIYFVSDIDGSIKNSKGVNSKDIWMVTKNGSDWSEPVNAGSQINTPEDEMYPFVHADGSLYFSSNGHIGMGGLDIFKATKGAGGNWEIENMKFPINSATDDFGICFENDREAGLFSSTRNGKEDDIFSFLLPPLKFNITGIVKDEKTDLPINGATVKSVGSDGINVETTTVSDGSFKFILNPGTDYVFIAEKGDEYLKGKERETTKGKETSQEFTTTILLSPINKPIEIENIFFDFGKADLRPESMVALDGLVETLNDNPNIVVELSSHTDARGNDEFNLKLSEDRAQSVVNYLITKGIPSARLVPKGYGETQPKTADKKDHEGYPFISAGQLLTETYINTISDEELQELAHFLNRRTEFKVLRTNFGQ